MKAPHIPPEVAKWLQEVFPDRLPTKPLPKEEYDFLVGTQKVVRRVAQEVKKQEERQRDVITT